MASESPAKEETEAPPQTLRARLWSAIATNGHPLKAKEMKESCAFYDSVRKDARQIAPDLVVDVCGGHGALAMLFVAHGVAPRSIVVDQSKPPSHERLLTAWAEFLGGEEGLEDRVSYIDRPLQQALPEVLAANADSKIWVVACHACQFLSKDIIDCCLTANVDFAVCPCCPKDERGRVQAAAQALNVDLGVALVLAEMGRLAGAGCDVKLRTLPTDVSPMNRILLGHPKALTASFSTSIAASSSGVAAGSSSNNNNSNNNNNNSNNASQRNGASTAAARLEAAYRRAQRQPRQDPTNTATPSESSNFAPRARRNGRTGITSAELTACKAHKTLDIDEGIYEEQLQQKAEAVATILEPLVSNNKLKGDLLALPGMEMRRSPIRHFRARTVVPVGTAKFEGEGIFRLAPKSEGKLELQATLAVDTLLPSLAAALPVLAELLSQAEYQPLQQGLRCLKLHGSYGGEPRQLLASLVYGPEGEAPTTEVLENLRSELEAKLQESGRLQVSLMSQARNVQRCAPENRDFVDEILEVPGREKALKYRQPFGQFSNPNPHIAIATAAWLSDVIRENVNLGSPEDPQTDLLELYCGAGSHTVALAPLFRQVLAVEINRHLVTAAQENIKQNGLENVTVIRAPSEDFCKKVLQKKSYELRDKEGNTKMQLSFGCTIVDPPRAGLDALTLRAVQGYDHVLYVSCNPEALKRDLDAFLATHDVCRLVLLDHFPFSAHAEVAVHLKRREALAETALEG